MSPTCVDGLIVDEEYARKQISKALPARPCPFCGAPGMKDWNGSLRRVEGRCSVIGSPAYYLKMPLELWNIRRRPRKETP